ncbi:hypothetical protein [Pseudomonas sp. 382]|uniref:hypothetical protein n=1 Tax=Pseudomonas sp. 382 TaxID=1751969 RepID=UPI0013045F58|nr:hypothetical protein [Pseudomonas sp. 382]
MRLPQSMGFPATDRGGSLEAQRYYAASLAGYWLSIHAGCLDRASQLLALGW